MEYRPTAGAVSAVNLSLKYVAYDKIALPPTIAKFLPHCFALVLDSFSESFNACLRGTLSGSTGMGWPGVGGGGAI